MKSADTDVVDATLASTLDVLDDAVNYLAWIIELAGPHLAGPIMEMGAGHGTFTESLAAFGPVHAVEPSEYASGLLTKRFADDQRVTVTTGIVEDLPATAAYGSAVLINVLEHIEDESAAVAAMRERLQPGGRLIVWVPAFMLLYSKFDRELGHHRRYRRRDLEKLMTAAGFDVVTSKYVNMPGWFSWLLITRILRQRPTSGLLVKVFDRFVVPAVKAVESKLTPPFGQSIFIVARKPDHPA